jgi:FkbM family methyltransferase
MIASIKSSLIGTPLETPAREARRLLGFWRYFQHPELMDIYLEERRIQLALKKLLRPGSCAIDVGAHIGSFLSLLLRYAPEGQHVAIEASPIRGKQLKRRFPNVTIINAALSDRSGTAGFIEDKKNPGYSRLTQGNGDYQVPTVRLDDLEIKQVDFIKLDIEGGEYRALLGGKETIKRYAPPILFECGSEYGSEKTHRRELYDFLSTLRYQIFSPVDFLFNKKSLCFNEFHKCGLYPFRAFNFIALPVNSIDDGNAPIP